MRQAFVAAALAAISSAAHAGGGFPAVTSATFHAQVLDADGPVLVEFWMDGCGPCMILEDRLKALGQDVKIVGVDIEADTGLAERLGGDVAPTVQGYVGGTKVAEFQGLLSDEGLVEFISKVAGPRR